MKTKQRKPQYAYALVHSGEIMVFSISSSKVVTKAETLRHWWCETWKHLQETGYTIEKIKMEVCE